MWANKYCVFSVISSINRQKGEVRNNWNGARPVPGHESTPPAGQRKSRLIRFRPKSAYFVSPANLLHEKWFRLMKSSQWEIARLGFLHNIFRAYLWFSDEWSLGTLGSVGLLGRSSTGMLGAIVSENIWKAMMLTRYPPRMSLLVALYDDKTSHETLLLCQSLEIYEARNFAFECLSLFRFACGFMVYLLTEGKAASRRHIKSMQFSRNVLIAFRVLTFSRASRAEVANSSRHPASNYRGGNENWNRHHTSSSFSVEKGQLKFLALIALGEHSSRGTIKLNFAEQHFMLCEASGESWEKRMFVQPWNARETEQVGRVWRTNIGEKRKSEKKKSFALSFVLRSMISLWARMRLMM